LVGGGNVLSTGGREIQRRGDRGNQKTLRDFQSGASKKRKSTTQRNRKGGEELWRKGSHEGQVTLLVGRGRKKRWSCKSEKSDSSTDTSTAKIRIIHDERTEMCLGGESWDEGGLGREDEGGGKVGNV